VKGPYSLGFVARHMAMALVLPFLSACGESAPPARPSSTARVDLPRDSAPPEVSSDILHRGEAWHLELAGCGVSSPRMLHVDDDGVLDIVLGVGKEFQWGAVVALSGLDGRELWRHELRDECYATACLLDIDDDEVLDVVIGRRFHGRSGLVAVSGRDGEKLWGMSNANSERSIPDLHFNTCIPCPDVDGDGREDLIAMQGGADDMAREASHLYVLKSDTGEILRDIVTPDGAESFFVPCIERVPGDEPRWQLLIGTGGETLPGHVYSLEFPSFEPRWSFASRGRKGFVASGVLHDFEGRGTRDAVVSSFNSVMTRLDGDTGEVVWQVRHKRFETYVTPSLGSFNGDEVLDVVTLFSEGRWPDYDRRNLLQWIDGRTGEVIQSEDCGVQASSTPVIFDMNGDGYDEVLLVHNESFDMVKKNVPCQLVLFDGGPGKARLATRGFQGYSAATPWVGHMDDDGILDVIFVHLDNVYRLSLGPVPGDRVHWNGYRGPRQDGVVPRRG
jgi:outer membrane protein assembly factor BamB